MLLTRLEDGINNIRFVTRPYRTLLHRLSTVTVTCGLACCELCKNNDAPYRSWYAGIKNNNNGGVYNILLLNIPLFSTIQNFCRTGCDPSKFDLIIDRQNNKFEIKSFVEYTTTVSEIVLNEFKAELNQLTSQPNELQVKTMHNNNYDLSKLDESYNCFIKHEIKTAKSKQLEFNCVGCLRPNDVGVKKCWWCEKVFTG